MQLSFAFPIPLFAIVLKLLCKCKAYGDQSGRALHENNEAASHPPPYAIKKINAHGQQVQSFRLGDPSRQESKNADADVHKNWGYSEHDGPKYWPQSCHDGLHQSPIDFRARDIDFALINEMRFANYNHSGLVNVRNTGHGVQVDGFDRWRSQNRPYIYGGDLNGKYILSQLHFHWSYDHDDGSEHTVNSLHYSVEVHLVHKKEGYTLSEMMSKPDGLAVVGVFMTHSEDGALLATLDSALRQVTYNGNNTQIFSYSAGVNLPENTQNFYRYTGSLTTPECSEVVVWTVLAEPVGITTSQLKVLRGIKIGHSSVLPASNARPTQPLNGRRVLYRSATLNRSKLCSASADSAYSYLKDRVNSGCSQFPALNNFAVFSLTCFVIFIYGW